MDEGKVLPEKEALAIDFDRTFFFVLLAVSAGVFLFLIFFTIPEITAGASGNTAVVHQSVHQSPSGRKAEKAEKPNNADIGKVNNMVERYSEALLACWRVCLFFR